MRVLVSTTAGAGHFGPLVPFARACATAGHDVRVAAPASFADTVTSAGFEHAPFDDVPDEVMGPVFGRLPSLTEAEANAVVIGEVFGRLDAQAALPRVTEVVDAWRPDVVLREPCEFGSLAAALSAGIPHVTVAIGVAAMTDVIEPLVEAPLAELDALAGLPDGTSLGGLRSAPTFTCVPACLDGPMDGPEATPLLHRFRDDPAPRTGGLPAAWGDPGQPLVYVSFGSVAGGLSPFAGLYGAVLDVLADQPWRVLLTTGKGVDLPDPVPDNARVERWWPQADVMPHAAAVVGHGGYGTTMTALAAGVPQVVVPLFALDQRLNAQRVEAVGAGVCLDGGPAEVDAIPAALATLLTGGHSAAARAVADEMATLPPLREAVETLELLASGSAP